MSFFFSQCENSLIFSAEDSYQKTDSNDDDFIDFDLQRNLKWD